MRPLDLIGKRFGKLVVLERGPNTHQNQTSWKCRCDCGTIKIISVCSLKAGTKSCGCARPRIPKNALDIGGAKFGRLTVLCRDGTSRDGQAMWRCSCECGNTITAKAALLNKGTVTSCGCYAKDMARMRQLTHGMTNTKLHRLWLGIKRRCTNYRHSTYKNYGGRGITICKEWSASFEVFSAWATTHGYREGLQIDRINNNGNYEPKNCRFVTAVINARNTRKSRVWQVGEKTYGSLAEAASEHNVSTSTIRHWCLGDKNSPPKPYCSASLLYGAA